MKHSKHAISARALATGLASFLSIASSSAQVTVDGTNNVLEGYTQVSVQDVFSGWGGGNTIANLSAVQDGSDLALFVGGRPDNNNLLIFIDAKPGGNAFIPNNLITSGDEQYIINNLGSSPSTGMSFEAGFEPDYALRTFGQGGNSYTAWYDFGTGARSYIGNSGGATASSGPVTAVFSNWTDVAGDGGTYVTEYPAHSNGIEMKLKLTTLGVPLGLQDVKVMVMLINGGADYGSNQVLGPRTGVTSDLGGGLSGLDWASEPGIQTITIPVDNAAPDNDNDGDPDITDPDDDNDGLDDVVETNTGNFLGLGNTGTNPFLADTDGDGYKDLEEAEGSSALGYVSNPNVPNFTVMGMTGSFNLPVPWNATPGGNTPPTDMTQGSTASLTGQYRWTLDYPFPQGGTNFSFKFTAGSFDDNWGSTGPGTVGYNSGGDINETILASGIHRITFDQLAGTYTIERVVFATEAEYLAAYGVTAGDDGDFDNLTASEEYPINTDPTNLDSDGDMLDDDVENNSGEWEGIGKTGTDPLDADSDDDTLSDGIENNSGFFDPENPDPTGTDPNKDDTDEDGENDNIEIFQGTDPTVFISSSAAQGNPLTDGTRDALYGAALTVQTIQTGFGADNQLDAGYAVVANGKFYLMLTGNLATNFNKLEIFIDSTSGGSTTFVSAGNDGSAAMDGMQFDSAFAPDYHLIARRGSSKFDLDFANLNSPNSSFYENVFGGSDSGMGRTGTGANASPILVAYDDSNTAGIGTNAGDPADQGAAAAVATGLELCIDLADLGDPSGSMKVMAIINNSSHDFLSNQSLAGLPLTFGNLGNPTGVDFSAFSGNQFFPVTMSLDIRVTSVQLINGRADIEIVVEGLTDGADYLVKESTVLSGFAEVVPSQNFTASGTTKTLVIPVGGVRNFYVVERAP